MVITDIADVKKDSTYWYFSIKMKRDCSGKFSTLIKPCKVVLGDSSGYYIDLYTVNSEYTKGRVWLDRIYTASLKEFPLYTDEEECIEDWNNSVAKAKCLFNKKVESTNEFLDKLLK